jgi:hypothetical protein
MAAPGDQYWGHKRCRSAKRALRHRCRPQRRG